MNEVIDRELLVKAAEEFIELCGLDVENVPQEVMADFTSGYLQKLEDVWWKDLEIQTKLAYEAGKSAGMKESALKPTVKIIDNEDGTTTAWSNEFNCPLITYFSDVTSTIK